METRKRRERNIVPFLAAALAAWTFHMPSPVSAQDVFSGNVADRAVSTQTAPKGNGGKYGSCILRGRPVHDFKLKDIISGRMVTFLETARRDYTFLFYLDAGSRDSFDSLIALEQLRDRYRERIGLVAIFLDPASDNDVLRFLVSHQVYPDFALHDPSYHQARCYGFGKAPALYVIGPSGDIIFTVSSSRPVELAAFTARLGHVLSMQETERSDFAQARDIYEDAMHWLEEGKCRMALFYLERVLELQPNLYTINCQMADIYRDLKMRREAVHHYSRYIGADYYVYDFDQVQENLRTLAELPP